jgi:pimeloyl-ACP methyl ester carboxylesterase
MTSGYRVVFLPGLLCDGATWTFQLAALAGHAVTSVADYGSLDSLPAMAAGVLQDAPGDLVLVGHSMGGRVALEAYRQAPQRIRGLVLLDTGYQGRPNDDIGERERVERMELVELARRSGMRLMGQQWVRRMVHPDRLDDQSLMEPILRMIERKTPAIFEAQQRALLARPDAMQLLAHIACPTLVLCGREDAWSPPSRHEDMARRIPTSELVIVERCGHMSPMEQPQVVAAALTEWLRSINCEDPSASRP